MPPKENKATSKGNEKQRKKKRPFSFFGSNDDERERDSTSNCSSTAVPFSMVPETLRNTILQREDEPALRERTRREREAEVEGARRGADSRAFNAQGEALRQIRLHLRDKIANEDFLRVVASKAARTAATAAAKVQAATKANAKAIRQEVFLRRKALHKTDGTTDSGVWKRWADRDR